MTRLQGLVVQNDETLLFRFQHALIELLAELRAALDAIDAGRPDVRERTAPGATVALRIEPGPFDAVRARQRACNRSFQDIHTELATYVDWLVAARRFDKAGALKELQGESDTLTVARLMSGLSERFESEHAAVVMDHQGGFPAKLRQLGPIPEPVEQHVLDLGRVRNCLAHHGGVARKELRFHYFRLRVTVGGRPVDSLPVALEAGEVPGGMAEVVTRVFGKGEAVALAQEEVEGVVLYLRRLVGPTLLTGSIPKLRIELEAKETAAGEPDA